MSTRKVDDLVQATGLSGIGRSTVGRPCRGSDERVGASLDRPLSRSDPSPKGRNAEGRSEGRAALPLAGRDVPEAARGRPHRERRGHGGGGRRRAGRREIVGSHIGPSQAEAFWATFPRSPVKRGLHGVKPVISDDHEGLEAAIARVPRAAWQRCGGHFASGALAHVPEGQRSMAAAALRRAFLRADEAAAHPTWRRVSDGFRPRWPKPADLMDAAERDVLACMGPPARHRTELHPTNPPAPGFEIDPVWRTKLLNGWDDLDLTLSHADRIAAFAARDRALRPWAAPAGGG